MTDSMHPSVVAFTGHRNYSRCHDNVLLECVEELVAGGARVFRVGMAEGFDIAAALVVLTLRQRGENVVLELYIPWPGFADGFSETNRRLYDYILSEAQSVCYVAESYQEGIYYERNRRLVEGSDRVVAWWNGSVSGTGYTVRYARKLGIGVENLYNYQQLRLML
jgi:uncharacterized phage-like protein YoqJ